MSDELFFSVKELDERGVIGGIAGILLLVSVFLPWFSVSSWGMKTSISPKDFSVFLMVAGSIGGLLALFGSVVRMDNYLGGCIQLGAGVAAIVSFFGLIFSHSSEGMSEMNMGGNPSFSQVIEAIGKVGDVGFYLYFITSIVLIVIGLIRMNLKKER